MSDSQGPFEPEVDVTSRTELTAASAVGHGHLQQSTSPTKKKTSISKPAASEAKPTGRFWHSRRGKLIAKGDPNGFDKKSCKISLNDSVHPGLTISLDELSVVDPAFALDGLKHSFKYRSHLMNWASKSGQHTMRATTLVVDGDSILLLKSDHRVIDIQLDKLNSSSQEATVQLRQAGVAAKKLIDAVEPNPFVGGTVVGVGVRSSLDGLAPR